MKEKITMDSIAGATATTVVTTMAIHTGAIAITDLTTTMGQAQIKDITINPPFLASRILDSVVLLLT